MHNGVMPKVNILCLGNDHVHTFNTSTTIVQIGWRCHLDFCVWKNRPLFCQGVYFYLFKYWIQCLGNDHVHTFYTSTKIALIGWRYHLDFCVCQRVYYTFIYLNIGFRTRPLLQYKGCLSKYRDFHYKEKVVTFCLWTKINSNKYTHSIYRARLPMNNNFWIDR